MHIKITKNINNAIIFSIKYHIIIKKCVNMTDLLYDEPNLKLLKEICSGNGVEVNISEFSCCTF